MQNNQNKLCSIPQDVLTKIEKYIKNIEGGNSVIEKYSQIFSLYEEKHREIFMSLCPILQAFLIYNANPQKYYGHEYAQIKTLTIQDINRYLLDDDKTKIANEEKKLVGVYFKKN